MVKNIFVAIPAKENIFCVLATQVFCIMASLFLDCQ